MSERHIYVTNDTIFYNSQCLFVEYNDVIKMPQFVLLLILKDNESMKQVFDMSEFDSLSLPELYEWYINRHNINFLKDLPLIIPEETLPESFFDETLQGLLTQSDEIYSKDAELSFANVLRLVVAQEKLVKKIIVYNKEDNEYIRNDLLEMYGERVQFMHGNFRDVLDLIPDDSTYVFSDINKINILADMNRLNCSSVIVAAGFRYNQIDSDSYKVNFKELESKFVFKHSFFNPFKLN